MREATAASEPRVSTKNIVDESAAPNEREIGRVTGETAGPTLIAVAGIHGNERAGVGAARRVLATLERRHGCVRGELVAFAGNLGAMQQNRRYRHRDMNRVWTEARFAEIEAKPASERDEEEIEQLELRDAILAAIARARGPVYLIDLHTTSADGLPFMLFGDTLSQRRFAGVMPLPIVIGLEEQLDGVLSSYWTRQGLVTAAVEGGQHDDPGSMDNLEAVLLLGAESAGIFGQGQLGETAAAYSLLERRRGNLPRIMEVISRRAITPQDEFVMEPGFMNLAPVKAGQLLARDRNGEIRAPKDGIVLLPLYQGQGADGFFWGREVSPARMRVSEVLRKMKVDRFLHLLPGIRRDATQPARLLLDPRAAGRYPMEPFRLLGFRKLRHEPESVAIERAPEQAGYMEI